MPTDGRLPYHLAFLSLIHELYHRTGRRQCVEHGQRTGRGLHRPGFYLRTSVAALRAASSIFPFSLFIHPPPQVPPLPHPGIRPSNAALRQAIYILHHNISASSASTALPFGTFSSTLMFFRSPATEPLSSQPSTPSEAVPASSETTLPSPRRSFPWLWRPRLSPADSVYAAEPRGLSNHCRARTRFPSSRRRTTQRKPGRDGTC